MADGGAWERQPHETTKAYQAFCAYRDMSEARSLLKVCQRLGKSKTLMDRWSAQWGWAKRVQAYDVYMERQLRLESEEERKAMARRHAQIATGMLSRVAKRLNDLLRSEERGVPIPELSLDQLARWVDVAVKTERLSRGEPASTLGVDAEVHHRPATGVLIAPAAMTPENWIALQEQLQSSEEEPA